MSGETTKSKGAFLQGLASVVSGSAKQTTNGAQSKEQFQESTQELRSALDALKSKIKAQREEIAKQNISESSSSGLSQAASPSGPSAKEIEQREFEDSLKSMQSSIIELHSKLGTGISAQSLDQAKLFISELLEQCQGQDLDARIRVAIANRIYQELGPLSWKILAQLMDRSGVSWPEAGGLLPGVSKEERAKATQYQMAEAENIFLGQPLKTGIESMLGIVTAWKRYPTPASWLWQEVAFRAVAAGIRCQLMLRAVSKLREEIEPLRAKANELLADSMAQIQKMIASGVNSIEDAEKVVQGTDSVVNELLPDLAWQRSQQAVQDGLSSYLGAR